ncbi:MAG: GNAT family N-acetyltransferase [Candidatus Rickettsia vulgarisii]
MSEMLPVDVIYEDEMNSSYLKILDKGLIEYNKICEGRGFKPFSFSIIDQDKNFIAGIKGRSFYGELHISLLWVSENHRAKNYGKILMEKTEELAIKRNCQFMAVMTMDWQARPFYEKLGFELEFTREGYDNNSKAYYLKKNLG